MANTRRRDFLQLIGMGTITSAMNSNIAKALTIPANHRTGTIEDVERCARKQAAASQHDETDSKLNTKHDALGDSLARRPCYSCASFVQSVALGDAQRLADGVHTANEGD